MVNWAKNIKEKTKFRVNNLHKFKVKYPIHIETTNYILKSAESLDELKKAFCLRHKVFFNEFQEVKISGMDFDKFDSEFDHLIILSKDEGNIVGTYRVNATTNITEGYTALEFDLNKLNLLGNKYLELGRACIDINHRRGAVINLLWRGIAEYMKISGADILYGCSSVKINDSKDAAMITRYFQLNKHTFISPIAFPTKKFTSFDFDIWSLYYNRELNEEELRYVETKIPSLLKMYLSLGAKIAGDPAYDQEFNCFDFLTVLNKKDMKLELARRYKLIE